MCHRICLRCHICLFWNVEESDSVYLWFLGACTFQKMFSWGFSYSLISCQCTPQIILSVTLRIVQFSLVSVHWFLCGLFKWHNSVLFLSLFFNSFTSCHFQEIPFDPNCVFLSFRSCLIWFIEASEAQQEKHEKPSTWVFHRSLG